MFNPFDLTGPEFLLLYGALFAGAVLAALVMPYLVRPEGGSLRSLGAEELAYLAGGHARFADAVIVRLMACDALAIERKGRVAIRADAVGGGRSSVERALLRLPSGSRVQVLAQALATATMPIQRRLVAAGLLIEGQALARLRLWQTLPLLALIGFGAIKWGVGVARERPVGYLSALLMVAMVLALIRFLVVDRRTRGGLAALARAQGDASRLQRAPTASEADLAVALFGTAVLLGSPWAEYHRVRNGEGSGDGGASSNGDSSSDGGSGCGGGGCGGCGGGGD